MSSSSLKVVFVEERPPLPAGKRAQVGNRHREYPGRRRKHKEQWIGNNKTLACHTSLARLSRVVYLVWTVVCMSLISWWFCEAHGTGLAP